MKTFIILLFLFACNMLPLQQKTEKLFGKNYRTKIWEDMGDYEIYYHIKGYYINGEVQFGITLKGVKNDTIVMVAKRRVLRDKIIVTEVYDNIDDLDSIVRIMYFKNGRYQKSTYRDYYNNKDLPNRLRVNDLKKMY